MHNAHTFFHTVLYVLVIYALICACVFVCISLERRRNSNFPFKLKYRFSFIYDLSSNLLKQSTNFIGSKDNVLKDKNWIVTQVNNYIKWRVNDWTHFILFPNYSLQRASSFSIYERIAYRVARLFIKKYWKMSIKMVNYDYNIINLEQSTIEQTCQ